MMQTGVCLVTGASGFVGAALVRELRQRGHAVRAVARTDDAEGRFQRGPVLDAEADWTQLVAGVDSIVHTAARVHVMHEAARDPLTEFRKVNVDGTLNLARQAAAAGVRRFVFISSIKVNGEQTAPGRPFRAEDMPAPECPYGMSKLEAEQRLTAMARASGMELVVLRPPLVYGPGVGANFERMLRWVRRGVPLPFGAVDNRRSLVGLDNLVDLIILCMNHPAAANQVFLVSDDEDVSTSVLLRKLCAAVGCRDRLFAVPPALLAHVAAVLGQRAAAARLLGSLQVNVSKTREMLEWTPPCSLDAGLRATARHFLAHQDMARRTEQ
ncbi:SDR family oxidoreductase [Azoarcus sp. L1K30]|uniref:UDP-glucose 4-epimerase family protein n=1 Tax=Azoarcus sp. L1K30 TaxID=2820277 RepID=UPI001B82DC83|nr:SDR family oxidoreductase [Azoarcus sp. L1K30]MBR0566483.1 SDR family oxidoreductase [Azoarcus sp. L1K30]